MTATVNNSVFNSEGTCTANNMVQNADGSWTLTAVITGLTVVYTDSFGTSFDLPCEATFEVTVPEGSGLLSEGFFRESLWCWNSDGDGAYTVTCTGFHMTTS